MNDMSKKNTDSFESLLQKLEKNVAGLESGDVPLEEALKLFEEGIKLSKVLTKRLAEAEESVKQLLKSEGEEFELRDFEEGQNGG